MPRVILPPISVSIGDINDDKFGQSQFTFTPVWYEALLQVAANSNALAAPGIGDISGTYPNVTVIGFNGSPVGDTSPDAGNILVADGMEWASQPLSGDATISSSGVLTIGSGAVSNSKFRTSSGNTIVGNNTGSTASVRDLSVSETKTMLSLNNVENTALSTWTGSGTITTLGTITSGVWNGTSIDTAYTDAKVESVTGTLNRIDVSGAAENPVVNISASYVGQATITTLGTISTGTWNGTVIDEIYGGTGQNSYVIGDVLYGSTVNTLDKLAGNVSTTKMFLTQTGTGLLSDAPAWDTIDASDITGAALTKVDDTNITLTLGGSPSNALVNAASITAGWSGQLGLTRGGTGTSLTASNGGIVYSDASALQILSGTATANKMLLSGSSTTPSWSTSTIPSSAGATANKVLLSDGTNYVLSTPTFPNASATGGKYIRSDGTNWVASTLVLPNSASQGDIIYSNTSNTWAGLSKDTNATRYLSNTGSSNNPAWAQVNVANGITGTVPVANGGTGVTAIPSFSAWSNTSTTLTAAGYTKLKYDTENWDTGSYYDNATNYRWTPGVAGVYAVTAAMVITNPQLTTLYTMVLYKNGTAYQYSEWKYTSVASYFGIVLSTLVQLNGSTDYIEIYAYNGHATLTAATFATQASDYFNAIWVGP